MRRKIMQIALWLFILPLILAPFAGAADACGNPIIRVGLYYGDGALPAANLENSEGCGYNFGYYDNDFVFTALGYTDETQISMLITQNIYLQNGCYYDVKPDGSFSVIGCYHIQLPGSYGTFNDAKAGAEGISGAFPAWVCGSYFVRVGAYATKDEALTAQGKLGVDGTSIVGTSSYGVSVVKTKTTKILFQYDGGDSMPPLTVSPRPTGTDQPVTWFKGYRYYGSFRYERLDGQDITVVNILPLEDYVKGVVPYEMGPSWPLEALKAQAVCARTYAMITMGKHEKYHFDLCNTTDCQAYHGLNSANDTTDQAAEETSGKLAYYNGDLAQTYYMSSDGGATENVSNVWTSTKTYPYLAGIVDPYETAIADQIPQYSWTTSFTKTELAEKLQSKGYQCAPIVDFRIAQYTPTGNVLTITFVDANGAEWSFSKEKVRTFLGLRSIRYEISGGGKYYVDGDKNTITSVIGAYAIDGSGSIAQVTGSAGPYVITSEGTSALQSAGSTFTISGTGWGHNVGMSQWGACSMAQQGCTYDQILKFYFTGIDIN